MANDFSEYVASKAETKFGTEFAVLYPAIRIIWENDKSLPPAETETCVDFSIMDNEDERKDLGYTQRSHEYSGIININVHIPLGSGTRILSRYFDSIASIFRDVHEDSVKYRRIKFKKIGEMGSHFIGNVSIEVYYRKIYIRCRGGRGPPAPIQTP